MPGWMRLAFCMLLAACAGCQERGGASSPERTAAPTRAEPALDPALTLSAPGCPGGTVEGCLREAAKADRGGALEEAAALRGAACEAGAARACTELGALSWSGRGVPADPAAAYALYLKGCELGDAAGCFSAGVCHRTGACAPRDPGKARTLLRRACDGGDARACAAQRDG